MRNREKKGIVAGVFALALAVPVLALSEGDVESFVTLSGGQHPEGVTVDGDGVVYFGNRYDVVGGGYVSELRRRTPDGKHDSVIATFAYSPGSALLGLVADGDGNVWAAVAGGADHGVWKVSSNGKHKERIAGSEAMSFPNALTFDARGNLYVTDSGPITAPVGGAIWRLAPGEDEELELWSSDPALAPYPFDPFPGITMPGANGIAFFPPDSLYVANTEKGQLLRIGIRADGSPTASQAVLAPFTLPSIDGIAVDVHGDVHAAVPGHALLPLFGLPALPPVVRIDAQTGAVSRDTAAAFDGIFDVPLSLAFDTLPGGRTCVFVTNGDLPVGPVGQGPNLLRANVGVQGFQGR